MNKNDKKKIDGIFAKCRLLLGPESWDNLAAMMRGSVTAEAFPEKLQSLKKDKLIADYLPQLAKLELAFFNTAQKAFQKPADNPAYLINNTLEILKSEWHLAHLFNDNALNPVARLKAEEEWVLVWQSPRTKKVNLKAATSEELMVLKILADDIDLNQAAQLTGLPAGHIKKYFNDAAARGIIIAPASKIKRSRPLTADQRTDSDRFTTVSHFTLQWHITHACDLHCRHCYDRSKKSPLTFKQAESILNDFEKFCDDYRVNGHVCLTGGNPFLHKSFFDIYRGAAERGFSTSILGNPVPAEQIERLLEIRRLDYFQVSLEGLRAHNDYIRGPGNFSSIIEFLGVLRNYGITSAVMLTLTDQNMDQVLPLAEKLRGHADRFTFNRLSQVGEGASLGLPDAETFNQFLEDYMAAAKTNKIMTLKDNLINAKRYLNDQSLFGGCTGFGCGAAFNFVAILPDGEVHACRKFPSPIGNLLESSLAEIYNSDMARKYRDGSSACHDCPINLACAGCMAVVNGTGADVFSSRDPYCLFADAVKNKTTGKK